MKSTKNITFYCVDNDTDDLDFIRENFKPNLNFNLLTFSSVQMFINKLKSEEKNKNFKIVLIDNCQVSQGC